MANGSSLYAGQPRSNPLHSAAQIINPESVRFDSWCLKSHGSGVRVARRCDDCDVVLIELGDDLRKCGNERSPSDEFR
jgi:hypothetical protein